MARIRYLETVCGSAGTFYLGNERDDVSDAEAEGLIAAGAAERIGGSPATPEPESARAPEQATRQKRETATRRRGRPRHVSGADEGGDDSPEE